MSLLLSRSVVSDSVQPHKLQPARFLCPWDSPGRNTGEDCCSLLQGIFPTQGLNLGLLYCRWILYHLSHLGSPWKAEWAASFLQGMSLTPELNQSLLHCRQILYQLYQGSPCTEYFCCCCCSVTHLCLTLCKPMDYSVPGFPIHPHLLEFVQTHLHWVGDTINHLIFCHPLLFLPLIFPSIRVFSNELALCIRWSKYWSFSFSISPSNKYSGLISFRFDWFDLLAVQGTL